MRKKSLGFLAVVLAAASAIVACSADSSEPSSAPPSATPGATPQANEDGGGDGGFANGCSPDAPIRYIVGPISDPLGPNLYDSCEALPAACATADAGVVDGAITDTKLMCDCVVSEKGAVNDAGESSCPGRGPIYCDVLADGTLRFRCAPP